MFFIIFKSSEQLQRGGAERRRPRRRHERRRALCRQSGNLRGPQNVCRKRRIRGLLQRTGEQNAVTALSDDDVRGRLEIPCCDLNA